MPRFPGHSTRRVTLPKIRSGSSSSKGYSSISTNSGSITADDPEQALSIVGTDGITVSAVEGVPDTIIISGAGILEESWTEDEFTPTPAQITFAISSAPIDPASLFFIINGVIYDDTSDYTVSGQTVTWLNTLFLMESEDKVLIRYQ